MRVMDIFYAFPSVLLAIAISGMMGGGMYNGLIALSMVFIPPLCRIAETATTQVRHLDFVEAARASGASSRSIILHHVVGNVLAPVLIYASSLISVSVLLSAGLSFLGLGVPITEPSLGLLIANGYQYMLSGQYWISFYPGIALLVTVMAINLVGDQLRDVLNPRLQR